MIFSFNSVFVMKKWSS